MSTMKVSAVREDPTPEVTMVLTIRMVRTKKEWNDWNREVQSVSQRCPFYLLRHEIDNFVRTHCQPDEQ